MKNCPTCKHIYPDDAPSFCPQDGTPLTAVVESNVNCQRCGYAIPNDAPFCANCGSPKQALSPQLQQPFQPLTPQPQMNQPGYAAPYAQSTQTPQAPYRVPGQFSQPAAGKRKLAAWQIITAIVFLLLGVLQILRGFHILR